MPPTTEQPTSPNFTLWFRRGRADKWRDIATRPTTAELVGIMAEYPESGEFLDLPECDRPEMQRQAARRVKPAGVAPR